MGIHKLGLLAAISAALVQGSYGFDMCVDNTADFQGATVPLGLCDEAQILKGECVATCQTYQDTIFSTAGGVGTFAVCTTPVPLLGGFSLSVASLLLQRDCCGGAPISCGAYSIAEKICANPDNFVPSAPLGGDSDGSGAVTCEMLDFILPNAGIAAPNFDNTGYADLDCALETSLEFSNNPDYENLPKRVADLAAFAGRACCGDFEVACEAERSFTNFCTAGTNFKPSLPTVSPEDGSQITCDEVSKLLPLYVAAQGGSPAMKNGVLTASDCTLDYEEDVGEPTFEESVSQYTNDCCDGENPDFNVCHNAIVNENPPCNTADDCYDAAKFVCYIAPDSRRRKLFGMNKYKGVCVESTP